MNIYYECGFIWRPGIQDYRSGNYSFAVKIRYFVSKPKRWQPCGSLVCTFIPWANLLIEQAMFRRHKAQLADLCGRGGRVGRVCVQTRTCFMLCGCELRLVKRASNRFIYSFALYFHVTLCGSFRWLCACVEFRCVVVVDVYQWLMYCLSGQLRMLEESYS